MDLIEKILTNTATKSEKVQHAELLNDENYKTDFEAYQKIWTASGETLNEFGKDKSIAWKKVAFRTVNNINQGHKQSKSIIIPWLKYAAMALFLISGSMFWYLNSKSNVELSYHSDNHVKEIQLADGSMVWLNRNSSLEVLEGYNGEERKVNLKGEAFFKIAKNPQKPFLITCKNTMTEVLGTSFNIDSEEQSENVEINVATGIVSFTCHKWYWIDESKKLIAGESCRYSETSGLTKRKNVTDNYLAWKTKHIKFDNSKIEDVCKVLTNVYGQNISCSGKKLDEVKFTAVFKNKQLDDIIEIIAFSIDANVVKNDHQIKFEIK